MRVDDDDMKLLIDGLMVKIGDVRWQSDLE